MEKWKNLFLKRIQIKFSCYNHQFFHLFHLHIFIVWIGLQREMQRHSVWTDSGVDWQFNRQQSKSLFLRACVRKRCTRHTATALCYTQQLVLFTICATVFVFTVSKRMFGKHSMRQHQSSNFRCLVFIIVQIFICRTCTKARNVIQHNS